MMEGRRLLFAWLALMALTVGMALAGRVTVPGVSLSPLWLGALALVGLLKARLILRDYLDLRRAPDWSAGFMFALVLLSAITYGLALAT